VRNRAKQKWFQTIAACLYKAKGEHPRDLPRVSTKLGNFIGVYGPPRYPKSNSRKAHRDFERHFAYLRHLFSPFKELDTAKLYYLDVDAESIPGTGAIIIDNTMLAIGWATKRNPKVDYALVLNDQPAITDTVLNWWHQHVMKLADDKAILDIDNGITLDIGLERLRAACKKHK
jgi:hypothetical protein